MEPSLYKKKITTIVKEYYKLLKDDNGYVISAPVYSSEETTSSYPPGAPALIDPTAFTESINNYFDSYAKKMRTVISASSGSDAELTAAEENLFDNLWAIAPTMRSVYSAEFSERFSHHLKAIALLEMQIIAFTRVGWDIKTWTDRISNLSLNDMANLLATYNNDFRREDTRSHWLTITNSWLEAIKAKIAKDTVKFNDSMSKADQAIKDFGSHLAEGIIKQKPEMFLPQPV